MAITPSTREVLLSGPSDVLTIYTPQSGTNAWLDGLTLTNTSAATVTVELWRGAPTAAGSVLKAKSMATNVSYPVKELVGQWVLDGQSIYGRATVDSVVSCVMSAREFPVPE